MSIYVSISQRTSPLSGRVRKSSGGCLDADPRLSGAFFSTAALSRDARRERQVLLDVDLSLYKKTSASLTTGGV